jgi:hypothetical protein
MAGTSVRIENLDNVVRALKRLPGQADEELKETARDLADKLSRITAAAGRSSSRQAARAAGTVRVGGGGVTAGPHPLLFGSEFGAFGRFGWYSAGRYARSPGRQFRPHLGGGSYWFFRTVDHSPEPDNASRRLGDSIIGRWSA